MYKIKFKRIFVGGVINKTTDKETLYTFQTYSEREIFFKALQKNFFMFEYFKFDMPDLDKFLLN